MHLRENTLLQGGKYKIIRFISSGGFGCTYEAEHLMLEKRVAIKEFFVKDFCNRDDVTRHVTVGTQNKEALVSKLKKKFIDEAKALCYLQHPGIVKVTDVFEENGTAYFVMDYIEGCSLSEIVKKSPLSEQRALDYIRQVGNALQYVHANNRLHLDVKPANIMITAQGKAVLIDFGASKQYDEENGENTSTLMGRTLGYAPPEQMGNDVSCFTPATDIYSLGATLYKALTGITPPAANMLISGESLQPLPKEVSTATRNAVEAAMKLNKKQRPQSISDFIEIIDGNSCEQDETVLIVDDKKPEHPQIKKGKPTSLYVILILVLLAIAVFVGWQLWSERTPDTTTVQELQNEVNATYIKPTGVINGHEYVDLGLSVKWATCNVGAVKPSDYGDYFAWGGISPKSKYIQANTFTYKKSMNDISGNPQYDAASANWGGTWRMPTRSEIDELVDKCTRKEMTYDGCNGYLITGPNGKSIFLPATGWRDGSTLFFDGCDGFFWSSTLYEYDKKNAYYLSFYCGKYGRGWNNCYYGCSVRPVSE